MKVNNPNYLNGLKASASEIDDMVTNGVTQSDLESLTIGGLTTEQTEALEVVHLSKDAIEKITGLGGMTIVEPSNYGHLRKTAVDENTAYREHLEPSGWIDSGTTAKQDFMFDPYEIENQQYRILNKFTKHYTDGAMYTNGSACISAKSAGTNQFGSYPAIQIGFQDCSVSATPMTLYYFDTADTVWRSGMQGMWRKGKNVVANHYVIYNGKIYQTLASGICGATPPTHLTGTVSDGNIDMLFIRDVLANGTIKPTVVFGDRDDLPKFNFPNVRLQCLQDALVAYSKQIHFLDQNQDKTSIQAGATKSINILDSTGSTLVAFDGNGQRTDFKKQILIREYIKFISIASSSAGSNSLFVDSADGKLKFKNSSNVVQELVNA